MHNRDETVEHMEYPNWNRMATPSSKQVKSFEYDEFFALRNSMINKIVNTDHDNDEVVTHFCKLIQNDNLMKMMFLTWLSKHRPDDKSGSFEYTEVLQFITSYMEALDRQRNGISRTAK